MSTLAEVRDALAGSLAEIPGLHALARMGQVHAPAALVELDHVEYHDSMDTTSPLWFFSVTALVSNADVVAAQEALDVYLSPEGGGSIRAALENDPTLGGAVGDVIVREAAGYQPYDVGGESYLGVRFTLEVRP